jgi:hypothetical protein
MNIKIEAAKAAIANGASFNGTVYGKHNGKNWVTFSIYLDGKFTHLGEFPMSAKDATKAAIENELNVKPSAAAKTNNQVDQTMVFGTIDWAMSGMNCE